MHLDGLEKGTKYGTFYTKPEYNSNPKQTIKIPIR